VEGAIRRPAGDLQPAAAQLNSAEYFSLRLKQRMNGANAGMPPMIESASLPVIDVHAEPVPEEEMQRELLPGGNEQIDW
jgi:hypothetical protein